MPRYQGKGHHQGPAVEALLQGADAAVFQGHQHLAVAGHRGGDFLQLQTLGRGQDCGFHWLSL